MKKQIIIAIIGLVLLVGIISILPRGGEEGLFTPRHWTEMYDMDQEITIFGVSESIGDRIEHERSQIEKEGYQSICVEGLGMLKFILAEPNSDEKIFVEVMENLCNEYK